MTSRPQNEHGAAREDANDQPEAAWAPGRHLHAVWAAHFNGGGWVDEAPGWDDFDAEGHAKWDENARIIAKNIRLALAAPKLLAACRAFVAAEDALLAELRASDELPDLTGKPWTLVDEMRAAIAAALGNAEPVESTCEGFVGKNEQRRAELLHSPKDK